MTAGVIVVGSSNTDLVIRAPRLPSAGETVLGGEFFQAAGGKGANQAVAAARAARQRVTFVAAVGDDDFGRETLAALRRENLALDAVRTVPGRASGLALIMVDHRGENQICVASGANLDLAPADVDAVPDAVFESARVLLVSLETPLATVRAALQRARRHGLVTILNPAPVSAAAGCVEMLPLVDVITPNEGEAAALAGIAVELLDPAAAARGFADLGCATAIITLGDNGCLVFDGRVSPLPACRVNAVDATAAGDAFNGALAVALAEGRGLVDAAGWATCAAALSVGHRGAQPSLPLRERIDALAEEHLP